jgi:hypothetical protein
MSDLLNSASLVLIPSGYKEDIVYSAVPTDGSGDLSFTRASNGTRINSAGLVEVCPWNLAGYSEQFDNAYWVKQSATVTANSTTAPNGTATADTFNVTATAYSSIYNAGALSLSLGIYTQGIYAKKGTKNYLYILDLTATSAKAWFNLDTGVVGTVASGYTATMESVGNGWYRCSLSQNTSVTPSYFHFGASDSDNSFTPSSSGNIYIWGAQLNIGSTAKPYFPTTDRLNVPRLTYQNGGGGCPSLLLEKQSTNILTYSEDFSNAAWAKLDSGSGSTTPVVTANYAISPDGTQNADRLQCTLGSSGYSLIQQSPTVSGTHTGSIWVKSNTGANQNVYFRVSANSTAYVVTPEWQRINITEANGDYLTIGLRDQTGYTNYSCDILIWGAQLEASSYPTSYIPTTSASATRVADACFKTGISSLFGTNQGTFFLDFVYIGQRESSSSFPYIFDILNASLTRLIMYGSATNVGYDTYDLWDSSNFVLGNINLYYNTRYKLAVKYSSSGVVCYLNGTLAVNSTASFNPQMSGFYLARRYSDTEINSLKVNQNLLFPTTLTNAELASLTTI